MRLWAALVVALLVSSCGQSPLSGSLDPDRRRAPTPTPSPAPTYSPTPGPTPGATPAPTPTPSPTPTPTPVPSSPPPGPVSSTSVGADGTLLVNGRPFLLIAGQKLDYGWWAAAGYTRAQADAKLSQLRSWGFNAMNNGNWLSLPSWGIQAQDQELWNRYGFYWVGSATIDLTRNLDVSFSHCTTQGLATLRDIVRTYRTRPNLLAWQIIPEMGAGTDLSCYRVARDAVRGEDPARIVANLMVFDDGILRTLGLIDFPFPEMPLFGTPAVGIQNLHGLLAGLRSALRSGQRFVFGISTTPLAELIPPWYTSRIPSYEELRRYFLLQVGMGVRAFEVLWGPNQRDGSRYPNNGDAGMPSGYLSVWNWTGQVIAEVRSLEPVILAPGGWEEIPTTPAFRIPPIVNNVLDYVGIYATKKSVGGRIYVVAVSFEETSSVVGAVLDVGVPIGSVRVLGSAASPTVSGSQIVDNFPPMGARVYEVTPR
jgi:hypothetical protein